MKYYYKFNKGEIFLEVPGDVYYPSDDSELLAEFLEKNTKKICFKKVLEIGCGSGFISILCAKLGAVVTTVDLNKNAVDATLENAKQNNVHLKVFVSNLFDRVNERFNIIIFNAPYLPENSEDEITKKYTKEFSMQYSKKDVIKRFLADYKKYLLPDGHVFILISSITDEKINGKIVAKKKIDWEELRIIEMR